MSTASRQYTLQNRKDFIVCHWCSLEMPASAKYCPHCQKLRIDIHNAKVTFYAFAIVVGLLCIGAAGFTAKMAMENHWWSIEQAVRGGIYPQYKFSVEKFLSSGSVIFLIILFAAGVVVIKYFERRVSKTLGTKFGITFRI